MNCSPGKSSIMRMEMGINRPNCDCHIERNKLQELCNEKDQEVDVKPNLSPENHMRRIVRETNRVLVNVKFALKYVDTEICAKIYTTCIRPHLEYASAVWFPHSRNHITSGEGPKGNNEIGTRIEWNELGSEEGSLRSAHIRRKEDKGRRGNNL